MAVVVGWDDAKDGQVICLTPPLLQAVKIAPGSSAF